MLGYLGEPRHTAERLREGWIHTGDAARIDPDGVVTVLGRLDDVRKVGGERISLVEVDQELRRSKEWRTGPRLSRKTTCTGRN